MKIAVIGAGIAGISAAYFLAKQGYSVDVFEKESYVAMKTSYANGGQISASNSEVWNTWQNVLNGIKWLAKKDAPLLIRPSFEIDKIKWLLKFLYHTAKNDYVKNTIDTIKLSIASRAHFDQIVKDEELTFDYTKCGILHFYKDLNYFQKAVDVQELYEAHNCEWNIVSHNEILNLDDSLKNVKNILGGAWTPNDAVGDIHLFCHNLSTILQEKYHVNFYFDNNIYDVKVLDDYDAIVVSNGVNARQLSKQIGDNLLIYPVKGYSITIHNNDKSILPKVSLLDDQAKIVTSTLGNRFRVAGTAELTGVNYDITRDRIEPLLNWVKTNFPQINTRDYSQWACLRPMTPNMMPIVQQSVHNRKVFYHTGHGHLGWTLSLETAKLLVKKVENYAR